LTGGEDKSNEGYAGPGGAEAAAVGALAICGLLACDYFSPILTGYWDTHPAQRLVVAAISLVLIALSLLWFIPQAVREFTQNRRVAARIEHLRALGESALPVLSRE
jgi:hypothetical protein